MVQTRAQLLYYLNFKLHIPTVWATKKGSSLINPTFIGSTWRHRRAQCPLLPVREAQSAVTTWEANRGNIGEREHKITAKMSSFYNKFSGYTMTQLNEILEDDEKLTKMVQEMDEVSKVTGYSIVNVS